MKIIISEYKGRWMVKLMMHSSSLNIIGLSQPLFLDLVKPRPFCVKHKKMGKRNLVSGAKLDVIKAIRYNKKGLKTINICN